MGTFEPALLSLIRYPSEALEIVQSKTCTRVNINKITDPLPESYHQKTLDIYHQCILHCK